MVKKTVLPCGLTVITDAVSHVRTVSVGVWVNTGSRYEHIKENGVAHFLEHMAFKGTESRSAFDIAQAIESVGGYMNAYTSREVTAYYVRVMSENTNLGISILADILQRSTFDPEEMEKERGVILQEIGQTRDTPDDIVFDYFQEACYSSQPMGRPILGPEEGIRSMPREVLVSFMKRHYMPERMVLVASGALEHEAIVDMVNEAFSELSPSSPVLPDPGVYTGGVKAYEKDLEQVHVVFGFPCVSLTDPDYIAFSLLSTLIGGGMSSPLFQEVREKRGLVYSVYSFLSSYADTGVFGIYAGTNKSHFSELMETALNILNTPSLSADTLKKAQTQMKASLFMQQESMMSRARRIAHQFLTFGKYIPLEETVAAIDEVTLPRLEALSQRLIKGNMSCVTLGPIAEDAILPKNGQ